jgi:hypothetical protein
VNTGPIGRAVKHVLSAKPMYLTISLFAFILLSPGFGSNYRGQAILHVSFTAILLSALWALNKSSRRIIATIAGVPWMLIFWVGMFFTIPPWLHLAGTISMVVFFIFLIEQMIRSIVGQRRVTQDTIYHAVSAYLMLGIMWTGFYVIVYRLNPAAFSVAGSDLGSVSNAWKHLLYLSYATLTTLGYGDITPVAPMARALAMVEATVGPLYLAVLLARLVGLFTRQGVEEVPDK